MDEELKREQATTQIAKPDTSYTDPYAGQLRDLYTRITERKPFEYNADDDSMYQQYRDRYMSLGREAMKDTIGQASALTGGYGSSYAQSVGHQAYDKYLLGLNDKALELYEAAYGRWKDDENRDRQNYAMLGDLSDREYGKWSDQYNRDLSKYELGLDEAGLRAQYGDFSGYADIYGDEAAAKISTSSIRGLMHSSSSTASTPRSRLWDSAAAVSSAHSGAAVEIPAEMGATGTRQPVPITRPITRPASSSPAQEGAVSA